MMSESSATEVETVNRRAVSGWYPRESPALTATVRPGET
jgi:hypothetical protein